MKKKRFSILRMIGYLIGFSVLLYPTISNYLNEKNTTVAVKNYEKVADNISEEEKQKDLEAAHLYNESLVAVNSLQDPFAGSGASEEEIYESILDINGRGMIGYIQIPQIEVRLPIYHGTSEAVLQKSVGHMEGTAFPIGGETTHAVLTGHSGLPEAELFNDLDQLVIGDVFYITIYNEIIAYQVDQIQVVLPDEMEALTTLQGEDYVTLVTCTPYGINTHRLLVRGTRIPYEEAAEITPELGVEEGLPFHIQILMIAVIILVIILVIMWIRDRKKRKG